MPEIPEPPRIPKVTSFKKGLEVRRAPCSAPSYVDGSIARADDFNAAFQQMTTEIAWGMIWTRPGLPRKTRSMINLTMLAAPQPRLRISPAPARRADQRCHARDEIKRDPDADRRLLRHPRLSGGVQDRHRGIQGNRHREGLIATPKSRPASFINIPVDSQAGYVDNKPTMALTVLPLSRHGDTTETADPEVALLDRVFFALSDPVRREILHRLDAAPLLVSELAAPFDISLQAVSRHIQVLVRAGLVRQERTSPHPAVAASTPGRSSPLRSG